MVPISKGNPGKHRPSSRGGGWVVSREPCAGRCVQAAPAGEGTPGRPVRSRVSVCHHLPRGTARVSRRGHPVLGPPPSPPPRPVDCIVCRLSPEPGLWTRSCPSGRCCASSPLRPAPHAVQPSPYRQHGPSLPLTHLVHTVVAKAPIGTHGGIPTTFSSGLRVSPFPVSVFHRTVSERCW